MKNSVLTRISHQDHGSRRRMEPACLTRWTSPHLIFESTKDFAQSAIHIVITLLRKILCESKSRRDHLAPGKTGGLVFVSAALERKA